MTARFLAGGLPVLAALAGCSSLLGLDHEFVEEGPSQGAGGTGGTGSSACTQGETRPCYTGPAGTAGLGVCKEGTQICGLEGVWDGACSGEVLPGVEDCATGKIDEDCNGKAAGDLEAGCPCEPGSVAACQTGKLGLCALGQQVCDATGQGYGVCTQVSEPSFEDCASAADEDCDGMVTGCLGTPLLAEQYGVAGSVLLPLSIATDSAGNVIVGGLRAGDFWLIKVSPTGTTLWEKIIGVSGQDEYAAVRGVAVGAGDEIIVAGDFNGQMDLGGGSMNAGAQREIFVAKRNKDGNHVWAKTFGDGEMGSKSQYANDVALDANGNIFITGQIEGTTFFGGMQVIPSGVDVYVARLDKDGNVQWVNRGGDSTVQNGAALATTSNGDVVVTGSFQGVLGFNGTPITSAGANDAYLAKLKGSDGMLLWSKGLGDAAGQEAFDQGGLGVAIDAKGNINLVGNFKKSIDLAGKGLTNPDGAGNFSDVFIAQFDGAGALVWANGFGDMNTQVPTDVSLDPAGNLALTGYFKGTFSFGGDDLVSLDTMNNYYNVFVAKFSSAGAHVWSWGYGDTLAQSGAAAATDLKGNVFITGDFDGTIDATAGSLTNLGYVDGFVLGFAP